jgi:radical SAM family uncharacterized protein
MKKTENVTAKEFIFKLQNPQVYTGKEINSIHKTLNKNSVHICLVFPDTYEIGMSHDGLKLLYHLLNQMENVIAERCFLPEKASMSTFEEYQFPLFALESKRPLKDFDLIGFSLLSETTFTNVLQVLHTAQIPLRRDERDHTFPIIAAGGISAVNPEPLRDFIDIFAVGDGEVLFPEIADILSRIRGRGLTKGTYLPLFDEVEGIYVPALAPLEKQGRFYLPQLSKQKKRKAVIKSIRTADSIAGHNVIVPVTNVVFNRLTVEIARGCPQNCRFCQAKSYYAPYRTQSLEDSITYIEEGLKKTGFETFSLSSLSAGDYPWMEQLLSLIPRVITPGTSFSLPSLRPSTLSTELLSTISLFRRTGITIVPEAGTKRLRRVINKNVTDNEIFQAVELALSHNWQKIKLYFMIGLPTETMEDIDGIVRLLLKIKETAATARKKINLHASFSAFVPKPHTPLQWAPREDLRSLFRKIDYLKENLKKVKYLDLDFHSPQKGVVETILARGDYRAGELLMKAFELGEIFTAWDAEFQYNQWRPLFEGTELEIFLSELSTTEPLPWDFFDLNYRKEYLIKEYEKACAAVETPSCSDMQCSECRGCFYPFKREIRVPSISTAAVDHAEEKKEVEYNTVRVFYEKTGDFIFFSHLSMMSFIERLIRKAGILFKCTEGFHPRIKLTALPALPVFASGLEEVVELFVDRRLTSEEILERLNRVSEAEGFLFKKVVIADRSRPLTKDIHFLEFEIRIPGLSGDKEKMTAVESLLAETEQANWIDDRLVLVMDYAHQGQERFAKIYKLIDPEKQYTVHLTRTRVTFKLLLPEERK